MTLFERTKETASKRGLSLQEVAKKADLGVNSLYRWKERNPTTSNLKKVADVLGVSVDYLLGNTDEMHSVKTERTNATDLNDQPILSFDGEIVSDEAREKILEYAQFVMEQEKGNNGK